MTSASLSPPCAQPAVPYTSPFQDANACQRRLLNDSSRLFLDGTECLEAIWVPCNGPWRSSFNYDPVLLSGFLGTNDGSVKDCIYIIRQENSWGRFEISLNSFQKLLDHERVFLEFLQCVHAFGFKSDEDENIWDGFHTSIPQDLDEDGEFRLCYNIRYYARHGRQAHNPWSLRQTGVYHSVNSKTQKSTWILLQPSEGMRHRIQAAHSSDTSSPLNGKLHPMNLHVAIIASLLESWHEVLEDLRSRLAAIDDKACFSRVDCQKPHDYPLSFRDLQRLQPIRQELFRNLGVLDSNLATLTGFKRHCSQVKAMCGFDGYHTIIHGLQACEDDVRQYRRRLRTLIDYSFGTVQLLSKVIENRQETLALRTHSNIQSTLTALNRIAIQGADDAKRAQDDSRTLKALTIIATMYLPATLIATIFSSNLVKLTSDKNESTLEVHFYLVKQFWLYVIFTIALSMVTFLLLFFLKRRASASFIP